MGNADYSEAIKAFHMMWDAFPGMARLIDKKHKVIAANPMAQSKGFMPNVLCAKIASPDIHKKCKMAITFKTGEAHADRVIEDRIRGWQPVPGYPDLVVHFAIMIPDSEEDRDRQVPLC